MKKFLIVLVILVLAVAAVGFLGPTEYAIAKSVKIDAEPGAVHEYVGELRKWPEWSPWEELDPSIVTTYGDKTTGVGAYQSWTGEDGGGELTFTRCDPESGIAYDMAFIMEDDKIPATSAMDYKQVDGGTEVTWTMNGDWDGAVPAIMAGWMKILSPWMIGGPFDQGLENLKARVEAKN